MKAVPPDFLCEEDFSCEVEGKVEAAAQRLEGAIFRQLLEIEEGQNNEKRQSKKIVEDAGGG